VHREHTKLGNARNRGQQRKPAERARVVSEYRRANAADDSATESFRQRVRVPNEMRLRIAREVRPAVR